MGRRSRARSVDDERLLPAVDPSTGTELAPRAHTLHAAPRAPAARSPRARRLRWTAVALALASVVHALFAVTTERRVDAVRAIDRIWAEAVAVDGARLDLAGDLANLPPHVRREMFEPVASESRARLAVLLEEVRALDVPGSVRALQRDVEEALRLQSALLLRVPNAIGIDAAGQADERLAAVRSRLFVARARPRPVELVTLTNARNKLGRYSTAHTDVALVAALANSRVAVIDIDASTTTMLDVPGDADGGPVRAVVGFDGGYVMLRGTTATAASLDDGRVFWSMRADQVLSDGSNLYVVDGRGVRAVHAASGAASNLVELAGEARVVGNSWDGLTVMTTRRVERYVVESGTGRLVRLAPEVAHEHEGGGILLPVLTDGAIEWVDLGSNAVVRTELLDVTADSPASIVGPELIVIRAADGSVLLRGRTDGLRVEGPPAAAAPAFAWAQGSDRVFYVDAAGRVQHFAVWNDRRTEPLRMPPLGAEIVAMAAVSH